MSLQARLAVLESTHSETVAALEKLRGDLEKLDSEWSRRGWALLSPGEGGSSMLEHDFGSLSVSLENVESYASGTKVMLKLGNFTSARLTGITADIAWGSWVDQDPIELGSKTIPVVRELEPGSFTRFTVVLEDTDPTALGYIHFSDVQLIKYELDTFIVVPRGR
jgi:hypothetical protein